MGKSSVSKKKIKKLSKAKEEKEKFKEFRQGTQDGEILSETADITSPDSLNAADTTAYPSYINKEDEVTHGGPRDDVGQKVNTREEQEGEDKK